MSEYAQGTEVWSRDEEPGYRTVVTVLLLQGGGGDVEAFVEGPRGGRQALFTAYVSSPEKLDEAKDRLRKRREVDAAIEVALGVIEEHGKATDG